jgi:hypothetical protein
VKTLHLSIIIGMGMAMIVIGNSNLSFAQEDGLNFCCSNLHIVDSPLKQIKSGIAAQDVKCNSNFQLIFKAEDGSPSCVSPQTGTKLIQMEWAVQAIDSLKQWVEIGTLGLNDAYNVGQPIAFSVTVRGFGHYPCVAPQIEIHDNKNPDMSIFHDNGGLMSCPILIAPDNYSFDFPGKNEHYVTSINKTGNYTLTISYGSNSIQKYFSVIPKAMLDNDTGVATLGNQTYYFETPNYTNTAYSNPVQISFHDVVFTLFPSGFKGGLPTGVGCEGTMTGIITGSGSYYWTDAKFPDGIHELLHIFAYSKSSCPVYSIPTYFSTHANPQAGLTFYDGKMKLLVSTDDQSSSALRLYLSTDSTYANPAEAVGVDISLNNTSSTPLILTKADNWPRNDLSSGPCSNLPFGMAILKGYYTEQNMTGASSLVIYQNIPCPNPASIKSYTFQPLSSKATQECDSLFSCPVLADMRIHLKVDGFMDNNGQHRPFNVGTYTIVGGDEWGHVAIQHFTEAYATLAGVK